MNDPEYPSWPKGLLTEQEAALSRGMPASTLRGQRLRGVGVPHVTVNGRAYYWWADLAEAGPRAGGRPRKDAEPYVMGAPSKPAPPAQALRKARKRRESPARGGAMWTPRQPLDFLLTVAREDGLIAERDANVYLGLNRTSGLLNRRRNGSLTPPAVRIGRRYFYRQLDLIAFDPSVRFRETRRELSEPLSYSRAHRRLNDFRGPASRFPCTARNGCQEQAEQWAYVGGCDGELIEPAGREKGFRYCLHPSHYRPLCRSHHRAWDQQPSRRRIDLDA
jgi:hypothetical protein